VTTLPLGQSIDYARSKLGRLTNALRGAFARGRGLTTVLAFRDLKDEALLSLCLLSAIGAVLAPIMVLAGLKFGFIEILRTKFIQDPNFRLITPTDAQIRPEAFFKQLRLRADVAFIQPNVTLSGTNVRIRGPQDRAPEIFDLMPTSQGDPLILEYGGIAPEPGEVTLTFPGAEALQASAGDTVRLVVFRSLGGRREAQEVPLQVRSVLSTAADVEKRAYVALELVQDVENFRAGIPVASRGWLGPAVPPQQSFDAAYLIFAEPLDEVELHTLCIRHGFAACGPIDGAELQRNTGRSFADAKQIVHVSNNRNRLRGQQLAELMANLGDRRFEILPVADDLRVAPSGSARALRVRAAPSEGWPIWRADASFAQVQQILLPAPVARDLKVAAGDRIRLHVQPGSPEDATQALAITVTVDKLVDGDEVVMHPALVGMLLQARSVRLAFEEGLATLVAADIGFRGYRLYARTIDDVPTIARDLQKSGLEVRTKADAIEQLQRLDAALTRITFIVAAVALLGGTAVLVASFSAAVERKKSDLSFLRLLGFPRAGVFSFPILQSIMVALTGFMLALILFYAFAGLINSQYASDLTVKGRICELEIRHILLFAATTIVIAITSSLIAARRALRIEPAEALRRE